MLRPPLRRLLLDATGHDDLGTLPVEFPTLRIGPLGAAPVPVDVVVDARAWRSAPRFDAFDEAVERRVADVVAIRGEGAAAIAGEVVTRWQRFVDRRNEASIGPAFDAVLRIHAGLHDTTKPLVKADRDHALDTWQWMLRLEPKVGLAAQLAALFHDVERLESEPDRRVEHHAPDHQAFKDAHARRGAELASAALREAGVSEDVIERVRALIASHERRDVDPAGDLLNDADGLSFFSLNSPGYLAYFGADQTRRKIAYTLGRLGEEARRRLQGVRLCPDVRRLFDEVSS